MRIILAVIFIFLHSCSSGPVVKSQATCSIKKHPHDELYQVLIDDRPVNRRWYLAQDAKEMKIILGVRNYCMR